MPRDPNRERMRARQACRNCRKKKARCPSEKPACSTCIRLKQSCHYDKPHPPDRLADLERKVELILNRKDEYSTGSAGGDLHSKRPKEPREGFSNFRPSESERMASVTPIDGPEYHVAHGNSPQGKEWDISRNRESAISKALVAHGIQLYFERFHRQPIWCFDPQDVANPSDIPTELLYSILELTSRLSNDQQFPRYGTLAKSSIFIRVSEGTADIEIIESLCLLSYSAFMDGNDRLGKSYLGMGFQLCQEFEIDQLPRSSIENSTSDRQKRSFWSLQSLEQFYGDQDGILSRLPDIWRPYYTSNVGKSLFPGNSTEISTASDIGIWMFSVHFGWAWSRVREYVSECSRNQLKEPWHLDSTYAKVLADMTQIENKVPLCHRYDKLKFYQRQPEEVQLHQNYWSPWLKLQFTWHAILTTINHPFLYITASQNHPSLAIPNTFWRRSSELVLLHATWTVRLIDMIQEKGIEVLDPFFAHAAAIAATVHIYFSCAPDPRLKQKSRLDYEKCRKFMATFSTVSHASERLGWLLQRLSRVAFEEEGLDRSSSRLRISVPLMWAILSYDISSARGAPSPIGTEAPGSVVSRTIEDLEQSPTIEISDTETPPAITIDLSVGYDATLPPYKASSISQERPQAEAVHSSGVPPMESFFLDAPWLWTDSSELVSSDGQRGLPSEPMIGGSDGFSTWWDFGNF